MAYEIFNLSKNTVGAGKSVARKKYLIHFAAKRLVFWGNSIDSSIQIKKLQFE